MNQYSSLGGRLALFASLALAAAAGCTTTVPVLDRADGAQDVDASDLDGGRVLSDSGAHACDAGPVAFPCFTEVVPGGGCCDEAVDFLCAAGGGYVCPAGSIRGDECTGRRDMGTCGGSDAGMPGDGGSERVACGGVIVCLAERPICPAGQTPQTIAGCYGPCVPIERCDCGGVLPSECPGGTCGSDGRCRLADGEQCDPSASGCGMGSSCCFPCGTGGCEYTCEPSCEPGSPGCLDGCMLRA